MTALFALALIPAGNIPPQFPNAKLYLLPAIHPDFDPNVANVKPILSQFDPGYQFRNELREVYSDTPPHFVRERSVYVKNADGSEKLLHTYDDGNASMHGFSGAWTNEDRTFAVGNVTFNSSDSGVSAWLWTETGGFTIMAPEYDHQTGLRSSFLDGSAIPIDLLHHLVFTSVDAVSDDGRWIHGSAQISPVSTYPYGHHLYYLDLGPRAGSDPVPEPSTLAVLLVA